jgi:hypothetical protein
MAIGVIAGLGGCATPNGPHCDPGFGPPVEVFMLFMGEAIPGRNDLTRAEWESFLGASVTPNLPNGYTVFDANGGWMNPVSHGTIKEASKVLLVALPRIPQSLAAIDRIRTAYQVRFQQQLVGMTVQQGCGSF